jgi:hypothetical protein
MGEIVIADNWSLQEISNLLKNGISDEEGSLIVVGADRASHSYQSVPRAVLAVEALFDFLTDVVLRDQIWVDQQFSNAWQDSDVLDGAVSAGVIQKFNFLSQGQELASLREAFVERMCATPSLKLSHEENVKGWEQHRNSPHKFLSQTLWGGAGMLARSFVYGVGYTPHPVRKHLFKETGIALPDARASIKISRFIREKRAAIYAVALKGEDLFSLQVQLPPLPVKIIQESSTPEELITIALQLRQEYSELRGWLVEYQEALNAGEFSEIKKFQKVLRSISMYVDSLRGVGDSNAPSFTIGIDFLKAAVRGDPINSLRNHRGVRSMINKLVTARSGSAELGKLLDFYQHRNSETGLKVLEHFSQAM